MLASVKALLSSVVDYAGLFPPAKLGMGEAMANYARYQTVPYSWMLGHFVLSASRLDEFEELLPTFPLKQWSLSVILSKDVELELDGSILILSPQSCRGERPFAPTEVYWQKRDAPELDWVRSLQRGSAKYSQNETDSISITALEFPVLPPAQIEQVLPHLPAEVDSFFEIPYSSDLEPYLAVLQGSGASAKIRTGGISADAFPSTTQLCQFILACAKAQVPFKATAGLHHPLPAKYRLTYEPDSASSEMHGFLNVAIAAALVYWQKVTPEEALEVLKESSINGFQFQEDGICWRSDYLNLAEIEEVRQRFFRSFGSCSFQEPIDDLKELKVL